MTSKKELPSNSAELSRVHAIVPMEAHASAAQEARLAKYVADKESAQKEAELRARARGTAIIKGGLQSLEMDRASSDMLNDAQAEIADTHLHERMVAQAQPADEVIVRTA